MNKYLYYALIGILTLIGLTFFPLLGGEVSVALLFPTTAAGWVIWGIQKGIAVLFNFMMFHCFIKQARLNIKDDKRYLEARDILIEQKTKEAKPLSPHEYFGGVYTKKGASLVITTLLGLIGFGVAITAFSMELFISQLITSAITIAFGVNEMKETEDYWTNTYYQYAKYIQKEATQNNVESK